MKSVVELYENRQAVGGATDPQLHSNRTVIHFKREYLVQLYYTRGRRPVAPPLKSASRRRIPFAPANVSEWKGSPWAANPPPMLRMDTPALVKGG